MLFLKHAKIMTLSVISTAILLSACDKSPKTSQPAETTATAPSESTPAPSKEKAEQTISVGIDPSYAPFVNREENGQVVGFDVELLQEIGKREGFEIDLVPQAWSGVFEGLDKKHIDLVMGGAVSTDERKQKWLVSNPYYKVTTVIATKEGSGIDKFSDVRGKKVAYTQGGSVEKTLKELQGTDTLDADQNVSTSWLRVKNVITGQSDAAIGTSASFEYYAKTYPEQKLRIIYADNPQYDDVVFIIGKDNTELLDKLNAGLQALHDDGTLQKLQEKWMGK